jgi:hypothetical protein
VSFSIVEESSLPKVQSRLAMLAIVILTSILLVCVSQGDAQQTKKPFTVTDEIGLVLFGTPHGGPPLVHFSPDGNYFAVWSERGQLDLNRVEDSLRFYRTRDETVFLEHPNKSQPPSPVWVVTRTNKEGPVINEDWVWLADSSGVAYLELTTSGIKQLVLANLRKETIKPLTSSTEDIGSFDVLDSQHYVYTVVDPVDGRKWKRDRVAAAVDGTGRWLQGLLLSSNPMTDRFLRRIPYLWAVIGGNCFEVKTDGVRISSAENLALSPDGSSVVTELPVLDVPRSWETLYPPPFPADPDYGIHAGHYDIEKGEYPPHKLVRIDLRTGKAQDLTDGPISNAAGWWANGRPVWSSDGQAIVLPGVFLPGKENKRSRPCVAVLDLPSNIYTCVEMLRGRTETGFEEGYHSINDPHFVRGDKHRVQVPFIDHETRSYRRTDYQRAADGTWQVIGQFDNPSEIGQDELEVFVKQSFIDPPRLVAKRGQNSRVIWDPNPQLNRIDLGEASIYTWKSKDGRAWKGGLFKPSHLKEGQRYPLVIQTHGFTEGEFRPSGVFPTAFAARALAGGGVLVLQTAYPLGALCPAGLPEENPCWVSTYEAAINQLVADGLVDMNRVGIIGFSHACEAVTAMLTTTALPIKAASVTDGVMTSYLQSMLTVDFHNNRIADLGNNIVGAAPFGEGLQQWFRRAPTFNLDKVTTPLLVVGEGPQSLLLMMWEPYAGLRYLKKPVDLLMLNTDEHILTNPAERMASQGGTVDWFRFWLEDYEDPDPAKAEEYARWRELRKLQEKDEHKISLLPK